MTKTLHTRDEGGTVVLKEDPVSAFRAMLDLDFHYHVLTLRNYVPSLLWMSTFGVCGSTGAHTQEMTFERRSKLRLQRGNT